MGGVQYGGRACSQIPLSDGIPLIKKCSPCPTLVYEYSIFGNRVELIIRSQPMLPDPNDEMVLETVINGRAEAIVTFNDRDFRPEAVRFRCSVVRPGEVIRGLAKKTE
jgi:predicted nucleic acid-binding protein